MEFLFGIDLAQLIEVGGLLGLFGIIFAESGLLIGFFLPGDSLLFTAGFLASRGVFDIVTLVSVCFAGAVLGDSFGYWFGKRTGPFIFSRKNSFFFRRDHLERARLFYETHGGKTIILARFLPVIRTCAPILAGVGRMRYATFLFYNGLGGFFWAVGLTLLGFVLGNAVPSVDRYLLPLIFFIIVVSSIPPVWHVLRDPEDRRRFCIALQKKLFSSHEPT